MAHLLTFLFVFSITQVALAEDKCVEAAIAEPILELKNGLYSRLTKSGEKRVAEVAAAIQENISRSSQIFEGQEDPLITDLLTMIMKQNHLVLGPPGAAKTARILWLLGDQVWVKQIHEWNTVADIFGGATREGIEKGIEIINTEGSALEAVYAMLDEINNANPALFAGLLSYLNPGERRIYVQGKWRNAKTRAVFSTGNATRLQILQFFQRRGMQSGPAMLNRFLFKSYSINWLKPAQQMRLDRTKSEIAILESNLKYGTADEKAQAKLKLSKLNSVQFDPTVLERLGDLAFVFTPELKHDIVKLENALHLAMNKRTLETRQAVAGGDKDVLHFESATEWSERTRGFMAPLVRFSAALDLMRLPEKTRNQLLSNGKPIPLSSLSLIRTVKSISTAHGASYFDPYSLKMVFNVIRGEENAPWEQLNLEAESRLRRDPVEAASDMEVHTEQDIFNKVATAVLKEAVAANSQLAMLESIGKEDDGDVEFDEMDYEHVVFKALYGDMHAYFNSLQPPPAPQVTETQPEDPQPEEPQP